MISPIIYKKLQAEIEELRIEQDAAARQMEEASFHDIRENDSFTIAKDKFVQISEELGKKELLLEEEVGDPIGSTIVPGRLLKITFLGIQNEHGEIAKPINEEMLLLFYDDGDSVVQGILSVGCELGRQINNGREGRYTVSADNALRVYDVRIYTGEQEEYLRRYPASKKARIEALLRGEF